MSGNATLCCLGSHPISRVRRQLDRRQYRGFHYELTGGRFRKGIRFREGSRRLRLLQKPDSQERQKNAGNQSQVGMGEYLLADTTLQIRKVCRKCVVDSTLKAETDSHRDKNRQGAQARSREKRPLRPLPVGDTDVKARVHRQGNHHHGNGQVAVQPAGLGRLSCQTIPGRRPAASQKSGRETLL